MNIIYKFTTNQVEQLHFLYQKEWWTEERTLEETEKCVNGSQLCIGVIDENNNLLGFVRVITDFIFKALIFDLIINETHRNKGIAKTLIQETLKHEKLKEIKHFELYCLPELENLYKQFGFSSEVNGIKLLRRKNA